ncbi:hypothetical protein [Archangium sp.]|uniref:hypothetical protein n=1 Tax=Archangium sp. TaxID=1872627 RepID=UPI00389A93A2
MIPGPDIVIACPACGALHRYASLRSGNSFGAWGWTDGRVVSPLLPDRPRITRCHACGGFVWVYRAEEVGTLTEARVFEPVYEIIVEHEGPRRVDVMARLRDRSKQSFAEVKELLARAPVVVARDVFEDEARRLVQSLQDAGASASMRRQVIDTGKTPEGPPPEWKSAPYVTHLSERELLAAIAEGVAESWEDACYLRVQAWWAGNEPFRRTEVPWVPWAERSPEARENLRALAAQLSERDPVERLMKAEALRELECFDEARAVFQAGLPKGFEQAAAFIRALAEQGIAELRQLPPTERPEPSR